MGMFSQLGSLANKTMGNGAARFLTGAGLSIASYAAVKLALIAALALVVSTVQGVPTAALNIMLMSGFGEFLSIIGAALLTKAAFASGKLGLTKTSGT